jgi:glycosyltransferase involved in cell wall biosynthesis
VGAEAVTVAIPVLNGGRAFEETLAAVGAQRLDRPVEVLVADSGSTDGSRALARRHGATVVDVSPHEFSHGATRNILVERSSGAHVAFLTQDSVPADERWLARLVEGFELADDVALVCGPYRPRPDASPMVQRELIEWFASFAPDGRPRVDRAPGAGAGPDARRAAFFSDANGCLARWAWSEVPFRAVEYAEDQLLAADMLAAGYGKAYHPGAEVIHSHDYGPLQQLRRSFDEWRGLREVRGVVASGRPLELVLAVQREVRDDLAFMRRRGLPLRRRARFAAHSLAHHAGRRAGAALGSRANRLPAWGCRALSLERRPGFSPVELTGRGGQLPGGR